MSFWVGLVVIVLFLEVIRIGLSSFLLLHILRGIQPLAVDEPEHDEVADEFGWSRERDRLASEAMVAVRRAMDGLRSPDPAGEIDPAITALDAYVLHHVERGRG